MSQPRTVQNAKAKAKENEEVKQFIEKKLDDLKERNAVIKHQLDLMKHQGQQETANANAYWVGSHVWLIYDELQTLFGAIGEIAEELEKLNSKTSKIGTEWRKKKEIFNRFKTAMDYTDELL